ncbi:hypothetical protein CQ010_02105 [Arthrobacter sp. MYb211]|uniref:hypothetical protein n=1 Tax=unclassified Arthrobacter TaxID=235627 RepID=UPI000CFB3BC8|nr:MULTISPECIES: hypothetical protein [unclassified Arthrobacter]PRA13460.1 hypothetical protein CQ015_04360 [Arthrobacter sp. MYb221]PRC10659.1 hypothetical protein CQ010_02105 [Arthrobacter sp. MYb211]
MKYLLSKKAEVLVSAMFLTGCLAIAASNILDNVDEATRGAEPNYLITGVWVLVALVQIVLFIMHLSALRTYKRYVAQTGNTQEAKAGPENPE